MTLSDLSYLSVTVAKVSLQKREDDDVGVKELMEIIKNRIAYRFEGNMKSPHLGFNINIDSISFLDIPHV